MWIKHDETSPPPDREVTEHLNVNYQGSWTWRFGPVSRPARPLDSTLLEFYESEGVPFW